MSRMKPWFFPLPVLFPDSGTLDQDPLLFLRSTADHLDTRAKIPHCRSRLIFLF